MRLQKKGLTLIELLIVIGIIAVLAGILWVALSPVREKGRQAHCMNNLRQIWIALQAYREDYNGVDPDGTRKEYWELGLPPHIWILLGYPLMLPEGEVRVVPTGYINDPKVVRCPNDPHVDNFFSYWEGWWLDEMTLGKVKFSEWIAKQDKSFPAILDCYHDPFMRSLQPWKSKDGKFFTLWATLDGTIKKGYYDLPWDNIHGGE